MEVGRAFAAEADRSCRFCGASLPASFFYERDTMCRTCHSEYNRQRYAAAPQREAPALQECKGCIRLLSAADFSTRRGSPTGLQSYCKECASRNIVAGRALNRAVPRPAEALTSHKVCSHCKDDLPRAAYSPAPSNWDGLNSRCKLCNKASMRKSRDARKPSAT